MVEEFYAAGWKGVWSRGKTFLVSADERDKWFSAEIEAWIEGYGYAPDNVTMRLSMACVILYAVLKKAGEVSWDVVLNAGKSVRLVLEYDVSLPAGERVIQC